MSTVPPRAPTPPTPEAATPPPATPVVAAPACEPGDVPRIVDLGLGRGLDATSQTPWLNKTSFQVRRVCFDELVGTDEGGALQSYVNEINRVSVQQVRMKSSITVPQSPVTIGVDAEMSRSSTSSRRSVGKKVINRTISYREDMDDLPAPSEEMAKDAAVAEVSLRTTPAQHPASTMPPFQDRLTTWICKRFKKPASDNDGATALEHITEIVQKGTPEERKQILDACREFIEHFRITHYVSAIELGAAEYVVMSNQQFQTRVAVEGKLGVDNIASNSVSTAITSKHSKKMTNIKKIGCINSDGTVTRRSYGEAVVGVKIQPVTRLISDRFLQLAMQLAMIKFIEDQTDNMDGPFIIACNDDNLFLTVDSVNNSVLATDDIKKSSTFYIIQSEDRDTKNEFLIGYKRPNSAAGNRRVTYFLEAPVSTFGYNLGPLKVKRNVKEEYCRFTLQDRLFKNLTPTVEVSDWVLGTEPYYINCSRRRFARDGYMAVKKVQQRPEDHPSYITACFPLIDYHDNDENIFMLFQLLRPSLKQLIDSHSPQVKDITEKLVSLAGNAIAGLEPLTVAAN